MNAGLTQAIERIPALAGLDGAALVHDRLGGLTNVVFKLQTPADEFALRIPGPGTEAYIDRLVEAHNARVATACGVAPELLFFDEADGLMMTRFLASCATMTGELFHSRPGAPARAARVFKRLHQSGQRFQATFELFAKIDEYLGHLAKHEAQLPAGYHEVLRDSERIRAVLQAHPVPLAPCHCDPLAENFLDDGERMWLVDWEYSGMNDPLWDLGDLSVEAGFDAEQDAELLRAYFEGEPPAAGQGRFVIYKAMCDLLWTLWGLLQHATGNPADDFWAYATGRFERCKRQMAAADFERHLRAIR